MQSQGAAFKGRTAPSATAATPKGGAQQGQLKLSPPPADCDHRELLSLACRLLHRSVKTVLAMPDRERGWLAVKSSMPQPRPEWTAYNSDEAKAAIERATRFTPGREDLNRYEEVLSWLAWLNRQHQLGKPGDNWGRTASRIIIHRATGHSWWRIAQRLKLGKSDETARRWHDFAVETIANAFGGRMLEMDGE